MRCLIMKRKIGRNDICPCGSGLKYKRCCMEKDKFELNVIQDENISLNGINSGTILSSNMILKDETFFKSKEDIFNSIINEGFTPRVERENTDEFEGEFFTDMEVGLVCPHGHAECSRTYDKHEDGTWEHVEDSFGFPCPHCEALILTKGKII